MFGLPLGPSMAVAKPARREPNRFDLMEREIKESAPQQQPRWAQALGAVGATMQDVGAAMDGRQGGALDAFNAQRERVAAATEDARRRQLRFQHFRDAIPETDTDFWQAYALGGEEAALAALQTRSGREYQTSERQASQAYQAGENAANRDVTRRGQDLASQDAAASRDLQREIATMPPAQVRTYQALGMSEEDMARAGRIAAGIENPNPTRDNMVASLASRIMEENGGRIPEERVGELRALTDAIYSGQRGQAGMSPTEAITFVQSLAWMPEEYRGMAVELISGGNAADVLTADANGGSNNPSLSEISLDALEAEMQRRLGQQ